MQKTSEKMLRFIEEIERIKAQREKSFLKATQNIKSTSPNQLNILSEKVHVMTEFITMFQACFYQELEEAKKESSNITVQVNG